MIIKETRWKERPKTLGGLSENVSVTKVKSPVEKAESVGKAPRGRHLVLVTAPLLPMLLCVQV